MCTLRNFPSTIVHCIEWARGAFEDLFVTPLGALRVPRRPGASRACAARPGLLHGRERGRQGDQGAARRRRRGAARERAGAAARHGGFARACASDAAVLRRADHKMRDLIHQFPRDHARRQAVLGAAEALPDAAELRALRSARERVRDGDREPAQACRTASSLPTNGRDPKTGEEFDTFVPADHAWRDARTLEAALAGFEPPGWSPSAEKIKAEEDEEDEKAGGGGAGASGGLEESTQKLLALLDELAAIDVAGCAARAHDFEKDLDPNFHIDFVAAAANLRARNYGISDEINDGRRAASRRRCPTRPTSTRSTPRARCGPSRSSASAGSRSRPAPWDRIRCRAR